MSARVPWRGRTLVRPAILGGIVLVGSVTLLVIGGRSGPTPRGPIAVPNAQFVPPDVVFRGGVRYVTHSAAAEILLVDTIVPSGSVDVTLLWFQGHAATTAPEGGVLTLDGAGGVLRVDHRLVPHRVSLTLEGREPLGVAAAADGYWITDTEGFLLRTDADGRITQVTGLPFDRASLANADGGGVWVARSPRQFSFRLPNGDDPLLVRVGPDGRIRGRMGAIRIPAHSLLAEMTNAGHVVSTANSVFFAPFIRDELIALTHEGDTTWVVTRGLPQSTEEPRFEIGTSGAEIDYAPVNLGLAIGPDGNLYVLSVPGFSTAESRLDVVDSKTGALLRSATIDEPLPTLVADAEGRVYLLDPFRLLTGVAPKQREPLPAFDLETLGGEHVSSTDLLGSVVLINFWASWCAPCREEMPALDTLRRDLTNPEFSFLTLNEDIETDNARAFLDEFGFDFPVLLGRGRQRDRFHYYGLPFTVLIDREGKVVQRWIGFAGESQIAAIKAVARAELARGTAPGVNHDQHTGH